ncbi:MAG: APC family permease [Flavobacteriaceae bacterium]|jgi:APA family basic amino acid/polyamine antiporter|nr:APC family permease [Flavobacteriaceae bacterium]
MKSTIITGSLETGTALKKSMSLIYVYAMATGAIFTFMCYWDGIFMSYCGPATFLAYAIMTLAVLPIAYVYAELSTMLPNTGSSLVFNTIGINKHAGFWSSWLIMAAWIAVPAAGTLGIIEWLNFQFNLGLAEGQAMLIGVLSLIAWCILSLLKNVVAGGLQTVMLFLAIGGVTLTAILYIVSSDWSFSNFGHFFASAQNGGEGTGNGGWLGWMIGAAFLITPYFGFETVPALVEEGTFPIKDQKKAILGSVITCGAIYVLFYFALAGMAPWQKLTNGGDSSPFISIKAITDSYGWTKYALFLGIAGVLLPITTSVLGFWYSGVRMIYAMGRQNFLPKSFAKTNRYGQPVLPNILILVISILFLMMDTIRSFFDLMAFACALCYIISTISAIRLARKQPYWERPFKIPGGNLMRITSLIIATVIAGFCAYGQGTRTWIGFAGYISVGLVLWLWMVIFRWRNDKVWMKTPEGNQEF